MSGAAPKRARVRTPPVKRDSLIAALIAKLPAEGAAFTRAQRVNWLRLMAMAMDGAFGVEAEIFIDVDPPQLVVTGRDLSMTDTRSPPAPQPITGPAHPDEIRFFIDKDGMARKGPGNGRVDPFEIPDGSDIEDEREGDDALDTIKWKSGQFPPAAYPERSFNIMKVR